jgi:oxygen-independent coproporphyrinogen-3 oxidase
MSDARQLAARLGCILPDKVDSIYLGGGTPSILDPAQLQAIFTSLSGEFKVAPGAEITVECAPGTLTPALVGTLVSCGVNRVSLGVQSFVDQEAASVGRLHKRSTVIEEIGRLREAGISNINVDLIAGLPHQDESSWNFSVQETINTRAPHVSVYMLEVDDESRLGRELIAGGTRYHAHFVPDDAVTADFYLMACEALNSAGICQYEISNFSHSASESRHNLKYWTRQPYLGFGVDAHSMLVSSAGTADPCAVRFSNPDSLDTYMTGVAPTIMPVSRRAALEETFFLGLRLNRGVNLASVAREFGAGAVDTFAPAVDECVREELLERQGDVVRLTTSGRLLSNEVFTRFLAEEGGGNRSVSPGEGRSAEALPGSRHL